jgi:ribosome-associated protein
MSRKPTKGYYVKGHFVAEGSELDLELKRELKGSDTASKTDLKRESDALQKLGEDLLLLRMPAMQQLVAQAQVPEALNEAIAEAKKITNFEGKRRQMQYVGKLMRKLDESQVQAIRAALDVQHNGSAEETLALHMAEHWRDRLLQDDSALADWLNAHPDTDSQQLRALVRQARKDGLPDKTAVSQGQFPRQGKAYRDIFKLVRDHLTATADTPDHHHDDFQP